jgi:hypothetical protein
VNEFAPTKVVHHEAMGDYSPTKFPRISPRGIMPQPHETGYNQPLAAICAA